MAAELNAANQAEDGHLEKGKITNAADALTIFLKRHPDVSLGL